MKSDNHFAEVLKQIVHLANLLRSLSKSREVFDVEEIRQIEVSCAELALLAISAADSVSDGDVQRLDVLEAGELAVQLESIANAAMTLQNWHALSKDKEDSFISILLCENMERITACVKNLLKYFPEAAEPEALAIIPEKSSYDRCSELRREIRLLQEQLASLVFERDTLQYSVCPALLAKYNEKIGFLNLELYKATEEMKYQKRRMELIRAAINRQEKPDEKKIEKALQAELEEYIRKYEDLLRKILEAAERAAERAEHEQEADEDADNSAGNEDGSGKSKKPDDIKTVYRRIVKAMHPDLHPNQSEEEKELFKKAVAAYADGDFKTLQMIDRMIGGNAEEADPEFLIEKLTEEKNRLLELIQEIMEEIRNIKDSFPYNKKALLEDEEKTAEEQAELRSQIDRARSAAEKYRLKAEELLKEYGRK